jgi:hypothetical protein
MLLGVTGVAAGTVALSAGPAWAGGVGSEPGNVKFSPASGAIESQPTWSTTDACPEGNRASAQLAIFNQSGQFLSLISPVAYGVSKPFSGTLDGTLAAILRFAHVDSGNSLEFVVGCYNQVGGTGSVKWIQSTQVTLSSTGSSFTTSAPSGQQITPTGPHAGGNQGQGVANSAAGAGLGALALTGLIAGPVAMLAAIAGFIVYRRRDASRLM